MANRLFDIHENDIAEIFGGRRVKASGALWYAKSDVNADEYKIECKCTEKSEYRITKAVLEKIHFEAINESKRPLLCIRFYKTRSSYDDYVCYIVTDGLLRDVTTPRGKSYLLYNGTKDCMFSFTGQIVYKVERLDDFIGAN